MTITEAFDAQFDEASLDRYIEYLLDLDDADRKALQKHAVKRLNQQKKLESQVQEAFWTSSGRSQRAINDLSQRIHSAHAAIDRAMLALAACGDAKLARRIKLWELGERRSRSALVDILAARKPRWLQKWVDERVQQGFDIDWDEVQRLQAAGAIESPGSDAYIEMLAMSAGSLTSSAPSDMPLSNKLKRLPHLLENEVWRLFEVENVAFVYDGYDPSDERNAGDSWPLALRQLSTEGILDRDRLLDSALAGMTRSFKPTYVTAYGKFFDLMSPNEAELESRQAPLIELLSSPVNAVVSFAMRHIKALERREALDRSRFVGYAGNVFQLKPKNNAVAVLQLVRDWFDDPALDVEALHALVIAAFFHESADVQEKALDILEPRLPRLSVAAGEQLRSATPFLADHLQARLQPVSSEAGRGDGASSAHDVDVLAQAVTRLSPHARALVGLESGLDHFPGPLRYSPRDFGPLPCSDRLVSIDSFEALLELTARLLENVDSPVEIEQLMDGIARVGFEEADDPDPRIAPILARLLDDQRWSGLGIRGDALSYAFRDLLRTWLTREECATPSGSRAVVLDQSALHVGRVRALKAKLLRGCRLPLLSTPTATTGGWLDPETLVARLKSYVESSAEVPGPDFMQAMLRLGPGNYRAAREELRTLDGTHARVLRLALGDDVTVDASDEDNAALWLCAAQVYDYRDQPIRERLSKIARAIPDHPGQFEPVDWRWETVVQKSEGGRCASVNFRGGPEIAVDVRDYRGFEKTLSKKVRLDALTWPVAARSIRAVLPFGRVFGASGQPWRIEWDVMQQPSIRGAVLRCAVDAFKSPLADEGTYAARPEHYLASLVERHCLWGDMEYLLLVAGMACKGPDYAGFAADALVSGIETGQADLDRFAATFAKFFDDDAFVLSRATSVLSEVAQVSDVQRWWVARACERIVVTMNPLPKLVRELYAVLLATMAPLGLAPSERLRAVLRGHSGASKTTKLAKQLIALRGDAGPTSEQLVKYALVRQRVALAENLRE